ncbi:hypothetical protein [Actinomadura sp. 9N215]|uniref:hypothetical protein n=1 Tax=Actinomadura sp. 9N215 TaxID=3375150 RepID=UPI0037B65E48
MKVRIAALLLRLPLDPESRSRRRALKIVLRAAGSGTPAAMGAAVRELESGDQEPVWRVWLWPAVSGPSPQRWTSPLLESAPPHDLLVDAAWHDWLTEHDTTLWSLLERWNRPATTADPRTRSLSLLALGADDAALDAPVLAEAAVRFDHPVGERARARILPQDDATAVDHFCWESVGSPDAVAFCIAHHLAPSDEVQRAQFFVYMPIGTTVGPDRRTVAVHGDEDVLVADLGGSAVNHLELDPTTGVSMFIALSPSVLVCCDHKGNLHVWREPLTTKEPPVMTPTFGSLPVGIAWSAALDRFLAITDSSVELLDVPPADHSASATGRISLVVHQGRSRFTPPGTYGPFGGEGEGARYVRLSPAGDVLALGGVGGTIDLYAIMRLNLRATPGIGAPMGLMDHEFLADVRAALANPVLRDRFRPALELLRDCLEHRSRHDIGIGGATGAMAAADDDIGLGR